MSATPDQIREAIRIARTIYARHPCGCCWHVVLDDGNNDDGSVQFCADEAMQPKDPLPDRADYDDAPWPHEDCRALAPLMLAMSEEQRRDLWLGDPESPRRAMR